MIEKVRKECLCLNVGLNPAVLLKTQLEDLRNDAGSFTSVLGFLGLKHMQFSSHHGITKHFSVTTLDFIRHPCCVTTLQGF